MKFSTHLRTVLAVSLCMLAQSAIAFQRPDLAEIADFDTRATTLTPPPSRAAAAQRLRSASPEIRVDFDQRTGSPKWIAARRGFLTGPGGQTPGTAATVEPRRAVESFVDAHRELFGHGSDILQSARLVRDYTTPHSEMRTWVWQQELDGIEVFEGVFAAHTTRDGALIAVSSQLIADPPAAANAGAASAATRAIPVLDAVQAALNAASSLGEAVAPLDLRTAGGPVAGADLRTFLTAPALNFPSQARLVWLPMNESLLRLCWEVTLTSRARGETFLLLVDAQTGEVVVRRRLTVYLSDATYNVFTSDSPSPFSPGLSTPASTQPPLVSRVLLTLSAFDTNASPAGWIDDGINETRGNNVDAHTDRDANNAPDLPRPQGSPFRVFDFPLDLTQAPSTYTNAAVVQLFYWCNWIHDRLYQLGFTEAAGNFQNNNFGRGGAGNDAVQADAQDGSGVNNANFTPTPDGTAPRIQMFVFTGPTPDRDGDLDAEVVLHEYTHGLSTRLVGGGVGISALQTAGMGEGWSDWYALTLLSEPGDDLAGNYPEGGYVTYQLSGLTQNYYFGIRRYPYSTDLTKNPLTFKDIDPSQASAHTGIPRSPIIGNSASEVHNQGEVWCVTLWDARANLIAKYGYATGNLLILQLVTDGMKLAPPNPNFLQARDAILLADQVLTGGANRVQLWAAFAKRGMGVSATSPPSSTTTGVHEAFDFPDDLVILPPGGFSASGPVGGPFSPASQLFTLSNTGSNLLSWAAGSGANWLTLSSSGGGLPPGGASQSLTVSVATAANSMPTGIYSSFVHFTNLTSGVTFDRQFWLLAGPPPFEDDFEPDIHLPQWAQLGDIVLATNYGGSVSGTHSLWFGGAGTRLAVSRPLNTVPGGTIDFALRLGDSVAPWEYVDLPAEGIVLEYSTNSGLSWIEMGRFNTDAYRIWTLLSIDIPAGAQAPSVQFRWRQLSHSGDGFDNWALDDVRANIGPQPPRIRVQPLSQAAYIGETVRFDVLASGTAPLVYQWFKDNVQIAGATNTSYTIANVQTNDMGSFDVTVTNVYGAITSAVVTLIVSPPPPCIPPPTDLAAWWRGEGNADDTAGTNTAIIFGGTSFQAGKVGQSFAFDGTNGYLEVASSPAIKPTGPFTVEAWVNYDRLAGPNGDCIVAKGADAEAPMDWALAVSSGRKLRPHIKLGVNWIYFDCATTLSAGTWYHVALVYDGANLRGYVNGNQDGVQPASGVLQATDNALRIGSYAPINGSASKSFFAGQIDEVSLYQRALSAAEIQVIYNASVSGKCSGPSPPAVLAQPLSQTVPPGADVQFGVTASGTPPLSYQWSFNGSPLSGQTNNPLLLSSVTTNDAGLYAVTITNLYGSATSSNALLTVSSACVFPPAGLVAWWQAESNGLDVVRGQNGRLINTSFLPGKVGQAFQFNGTNAYVEVPSTASLKPSGPFSVEGWINYDRLTGPNGDAIISKGLDAESKEDWALAVSSTSKLRPHVLSGGGWHYFDCATTLFPGVWYHVAMVYDGSNLRGYVNGVQDGAAAASGAVQATDQPLRIGAYAPINGTASKSFFAGGIDELSVYNRALSPVEIQTVYLAGLAGKCVSGLPPFLLAQPQNQITAVGAAPSLSVAVIGGAPFTYQWRFNGAPIPGGTNVTLTLAGVTTNDAGLYSVAISNAVGYAISSNATLTVVEPGTGFYDDFEPDIDLPQWSAFGGTLGETVIVTNYGGSVSGSNSLWFGDTATRFAATRSIDTLSGGTIAFQLRFGSSNGPVWENVDLPAKGVVLEYSTDGGINWTQIIACTTTNFYNWTQVTTNIPGAAQTAATRFRWRQLAHSGAGFDHWALDDVLISATPLPVVITNQPGSATALLGTTAAFTVGVSGAPPFDYQWYFKGALMPLKTNSTLVISNVGFADAGSYFVTVNNAYGAATSATVPLNLLRPGAIYGFTNSTAIQIPVGTGAVPYPSTLGVFGVTGVIANVTATLHNVTHSSPNDLDILLVGPGGQKVILMSDAIGTNSQAISNVTLTFDDQAAGFLPEFGSVSSGTFRPTDYPPSDSFPAPAPAPPYATNLSVFTTANVNGTWSLFVVDDNPASDGGAIAGGWQLSIQVARAVGPQFAQPAPGAGGFQLIFYSPDGQPYTLNDLASFTAETSSNLFNWVPLPAALALLPDGRMQIVDTNSPEAQRFYRLKEY